MQQLGLSREKVDQLQDAASLTNLFFTAAETERRLPAIRRQTVKTCWPDYPDDPQAYGYTEEPLRLDPASARDVSDYEVALELSMLLDVEERRVLWAVVHSAAFRTRGAQWRSLSRQLGVAPPTVKRRFEYAVLHLWQLIGHMATSGVSNGAKSDNLLVRCGS